METRKVAIVTGGERGIGRGISDRLRRDGWLCVAAGIDDRAGNACAEADPDHVFRHCDVSSEDQVSRLIEWTLQRFGRIDALVLNAGIASPERHPIEQLTLTEWERVLAVNLTGAFLCAKTAAPALKAASGSIVLIASTRAEMSEANTFAYSASKGGLVALTHALAISLGPEIRANAISPGWIHTGAEAELSPTDHAQHPVGRVGSPDDIASLTAYLLSEDSKFITGQNFIVDGGMTKKMIYAE